MDRSMYNILQGTVVLSGVRTIPDSEMGRCKMCILDRASVHNSSAQQSSVNSFERERLLLHDDSRTPPIHIVTEQL